MVLRRWSVVVALSGLLAASCGEGGEATDEPTPPPRVTESAVAETPEAETPETETPEAETPAVSSTPRPDGAVGDAEVVAAVPGDGIQLSISQSLGAEMTGREFDVFLAPFQDSNASAHAVAGLAIVGSDTVELALAIPHVFAALEPTEPGGPLLGRVEPLSEGDYAVWLGGQRPQYAVPLQRLDGLLVRVGAMGDVEVPDVSDVVVDPARALLGEAGLGDLAFDTPVTAALAALENQFGPPIDDSGWRDGCYFGRTVGWPGLRAEFHGTDNGTGRFVSYVTDGDTPLGPLTTVDGVAVGMSVAEAMALAPASVFSSDRNSSSPAAFTWWADAAAFGGLAGRLDVDATQPAATLTSIGNGNPHPYFGC